MKNIVLYKLVLPFCLDGSASSWFKTAKTAPLPRQDLVGQAPVPAKFNLGATAQHYGTQALSASENALRTSGNFIKNTVSAHPYATATLGAYVALGAYVWYQHGKQARLLKNLQAKQKHYESHKITVPQQLLSDISLAKRRAKRATEEKLIARPKVLVPYLLVGALLLAVGLDAFKTFELTLSLSTSRFMLPEYAINLLPKTDKNPAVDFAGYRAIYTFARQRYFKPSDLALKTCLGATGGLLFFLQRWTAIRNKSAESVH